MPRSHRTVRARYIATTLLALFVLAHGPAQADKVGRLMRQMVRSNDYKVRLSAALNLAKIGDRRAIPAFVAALRDDDKTVRGVAATAIGKLVDGRSGTKTRRRALSALRRVATKDRHRFVRKQAKKSYRSIKRLPDRSARRADVYVDVGKMSDKTDADGRLRSAMREATGKAIAKGGSSMTTAWPGGSPSGRQLAKSGTKGFHVDGTLTKLTRKSRGSATIVSCKVSMVLASYPKKSMFGFLSGGAQVQAGSSSSQVEYAERNCVLAVVKSLVTKKIIPTIEARAR